MSPARLQHSANLTAGCESVVFTSYFVQQTVDDALGLAQWVTQKLRERAVALQPAASRLGRLGCFVALLDEHVAFLVNQTDVEPWKLPATPPMCDQLPASKCNPRARAKIAKSVPICRFKSVRPKPMQA